MPLKMLRGVLLRGLLRMLLDLRESISDTRLPARYPTHLRGLRNAETTTHEPAPILGCSGNTEHPQGDRGMRVIAALLQNVSLRHQEAGTRSSARNPGGSAEDHSTLRARPRTHAGRSAASRKKPCRRDHARPCFYPGQSAPAGGRPAGNRGWRDHSRITRLIARDFPRWALCYSKGRLRMSHVAWPRPCGVKPHIRSGGYSPVRPTPRGESVGGAFACRCSNAK